jgi:NAD(P)-dependent dehydrogenase (short-subunit alcohol dehydrogenase family)
VGVDLKKISEQVMVITGATSGIGLVTARMAAERDAKVVLAARNEAALHELEQAINSSGGEAVSVTADVGNEADVRRIAEKAVERFGRLDTWVNNAGVSIYGKIMDVSTEDHLRLFETNYWGVVHGSKTAVEYLSAQGGALINIGSTLSDRAIPIQGHYCASKHAVKGFTDALRMELEYDNLPISVTLIKPASIDTPYKEHAKSYLESAPENPPPVYAPETVAETILYCAENPVRDVFVGAGGKILSAVGEYAPRLTDKVMEALIFDAQKKEIWADGKDHKEGLYNSNDNSLTERGGYEGHVSESSLYTTASLHPVWTGMALTALGAGLVYSFLRQSRDQ